MPTFPARYPGTCPRCGFAIEVGQLIRYNSRAGIKAQHENCEKLAEDAESYIAAITDRAVLIARWMDANPMPTPWIQDEPGAPVLDLENACDDEERRWALGQYEKERQAWLKQHPEAEKRYLARLDAWEKRRIAFERTLDAARRQPTAAESRHRSADGAPTRGRTA